MKPTVLTSIALCIVAIVISVAPSQSDVSAQQPDLGPVGVGIVGIWDVQTTNVDCTTGVPLNPPEKSFVSYNQGGTYIEEASGVPTSSATFLLNQTLASGVA